MNSTYRSIVKPKNQTVSQPEVQTLHLSMFLLRIGCATLMFGVILHLA